MDNYTLRTFTPTAMMMQPSVSNPDRRTTGAKLTADLMLTGSITAVVGIESQRNRHTDRSTMNQGMVDYQALVRVEDARFSNDGAFAEVTLDASEGRRLVTGLRADRWSVRDERATLRIGMMSMANPTAGSKRQATLTSGFARYEVDIANSAATVYAGVGHVERFPDYWELISAAKESAGSLSAFRTLPEKTTQLDTGLLFNNERFTVSLSAFLGEVDDYILIQSGYLKGTRATTITRNIDARTWGGEADIAYALSPRWNVTGTLAYTRGDNRTDDLPLAQMSPLEARAGLNFTDERWSAGALMRWVDGQDRYAINQGNIVGQDLGPSDGFTVFSANGAWRPRDGVSVSLGIDNLLDTTYAEHLSRGGAMVTGFQQTTRVNEPGRTGWLRLALRFD